MPATAAVLPVKPVAEVPTAPRSDIAALSEATEVVPEVERQTVSEREIRSAAPAISEDKGNLPSIGPRSDSIASDRTRIDVLVKLAFYAVLATLGWFMFRTTGSRPTTAPG